MTMREYLLTVSEYATELNIYDPYSNVQITDSNHLIRYINSRSWIGMKFDGFSKIITNYDDDYENIIGGPLLQHSEEKRKGMYDFLFSFIRRSKIDEFLR